MAILKKIELAAKSGMNRFLEGSGTPAVIDSCDKKIELPASPRILLLRQDRIGDVLVSVPVIRNIRKALPRARIDILLGRKNHGVRRVVENYCDNVYIYNKKIASVFGLISQLRKNKYDLAVDMLDNRSATSSLLIKNCGATQTLGFDKENRGIYTCVVPQADRRKVHIVERFARLLPAFGVDPAGCDLSLEYPLTQEEKVAAHEKMGPKECRKRVGINLSGSDRAKFWGVENNIELIKKITGEKPSSEIRIFSTPDYAAETEAICSRTVSTPAARAANVHKYAAMLSTCDMIITPDTAAVHFAAAWKIPCIALYSTPGHGINGMPWHPYDSPHRMLSTDQPPLSNIPPEEVFHAYKDLLK